MIVFIHNEVHWKPSQQQLPKRWLQARRNAQWTADLRK